MLCDVIQVGRREMFVECLSEGFYSKSNKVSRVDLVVPLLIQRT